MPISFSPAKSSIANTRPASRPCWALPTPARPISLSSACWRIRRASSDCRCASLREVYNKIANRVGTDAVALVTGEEKIKPPNPRFWVCTVEAMPRDLDVAFMAIDEVQLGADFERGHVFTDRMLNARARETLVLGASTVRPMVEKLLPGAHIVSRPRLSTLSYAGEKKLTRLPPRSAIVAFSADEVYAIAELIRRQRGGAAVVLGALSPERGMRRLPYTSPATSITSWQQMRSAWDSISTSIMSRLHPTESSTAISFESSIRPNSLKSRGERAGLP